MWLFAGRCQLAVGAPAQGSATGVRYSGVLHCVSDRSASSIRLEDVAPARLLPGATYIAPLEPVCMAMVGGLGDIAVWCVNETVLDGTCPETTAQTFGSITQVGDGTAVPGLPSKGGA